MIGDESSGVNADRRIGLIGPERVAAKASPTRGLNEHELLYTPMDLSENEIG